jgi:molybdenum cofactor biosynthesis enzyme MoaA
MVVDELGRRASQVRLVLLDQVNIGCEELD